MLDLRDRLFELEEKWSTSLDFRLAIDIGIGDGLGRRHRSAEPQPVGRRGRHRQGPGRHRGAAHHRASETAYELLSDHFLFRPRGSYFLPETGNMRTFVLVGRI